MTEHWENGDYYENEVDKDPEDYMDDKLECEECGCEIHGRSYRLDDYVVCEQCYDRAVGIDAI